MTTQPDELDTILVTLIDDITIAGYGKKDHPNPLIGKRDKQPFAGYKFCTDKAHQAITTMIRANNEAQLYDLDEIDNKPWRVFRQLAKIMPEYADTYSRYEKFYSHGGCNEVIKLIEKFEKENPDA